MLVHHDRTKRIENDRHFIKETRKLEAKTIWMPFVPSSQQTADILSIGLARHMFEPFISKLRMIDSMHQLGGNVGNVRNIIKGITIILYSTMFPP